MKRAILNEQYLNGYIINENAPIGTIMQFAKNCPNGSVNCNGQSLSRTNYNRLFAIIGTTYGADDEDTFKVPLITDKAEVDIEYMTGKRDTDGRPIYLKTYKSITTTSASNWGNVSNDVIDNILNIKNGYVSKTDKQGYGCFLRIYSNRLQCYIPNAGISANDLVTVEYTKTTDTADTFCYNQLAGSNFCIKATDYTQVTEDVLDDSKATTGNVWSAAKTKAEIDAKQKYSTEEKVIGEWIDGKPIYRKVVADLSVGLGNSWNTVANIPNIDKLISFNLHGTDAGLQTVATLYAKVDSNKNIVVYSSGWSQYANTVILEYTKTTD